MDIGINYTKPNDPDHVDDPLDWLSSSLTFAAALSHLLKEKEGVCVKVRGDMNLLNPEMTQVIVVKQDEMIKVIDISEEPELEEGTLIWYNKK